MKIKRAEAMRPHLLNASKEKSQAGGKNENHVYKGFLKGHFKMSAKEEKANAFKEYLQTMGYCKGIICQLPECVKDFFANSEENELTAISARHIKDFYLYLQQRPNKRRAGGLSQSRIAHYLYALRLFFNYLEMTGEIMENPMSQLTFPSPESNPREILTQQEIRKFFESCATRRETAIVHLFYSCGLRRKEAVQTNIRDIQFKTQLLYIREGKGRKRRVVPLTKKVKDDLWNYLLEERNLYANQQSPPDAFILNKRGGRMQGPGYSAIIKQLLKRTDITKEITPHCLRHSIATHLLENGVKVEYVRDFLGHEFLETTQIYTKISKKQLLQLTANAPAHDL